MTFFYPLTDVAASEKCLGVRQLAFRRSWFRHAKEGSEQRSLDDALYYWLEAQGFTKAAAK
jgi:hypothetical protein